MMRAAHAIDAAPESCAHTHVRENPLTIERPSPVSRYVKQIGYCLDCGFYVVRRTPSVAFGAWGVRTARNP